MSRFALFPAQAAQSDRVCWVQDYGPYQLNVSLGSGQRAIEYDLHKQDSVIVHPKEHRTFLLQVFQDLRCGKTEA